MKRIFLCDLKMQCWEKEIVKEVLLLSLEIIYLYIRRYQLVISYVGFRNCVLGAWVLSDFFKLIKRDILYCDHTIFKSLYLVSEQNLKLFL